MGAETVLGLLSPREYPGTLNCPFKGGCGGVCENLCVCTYEVWGKCVRGCVCVCSRASPLDRNYYAGNSKAAAASVSRQIPLPAPVLHCSGLHTCLTSPHMQGPAPKPSRRSRANPALPTKPLTSATAEEDPGRVLRPSTRPNTAQPPAGGRQAAGKKAVRP